MEIIETYWNVNLIYGSQMNGLRGEIIETYWNVNSYSCLYVFSCDYRNNRNILECKSIYFVLMFHKGSEK